MTGGRETEGDREIRGDRQGGLGRLSPAGGALRSWKGRAVPSGAQDQERDRWEMNERQRARQGPGGEDAMTEA